MKARQIIAAEKLLSIHLASHFTFAGLLAVCGGGIQACDDGWSNEINYWGKTGIVKTKGWELITTRHDLVTCKKCLKKTVKIRSRKKA